MRPAAAARRLVFLHGFTQTHHHWRHCADRLAARFDRRPTCGFVDIDGHGLADDDRDDTIDSCGPAVLSVGGPGTYVGYSMGGRVALVAAATDTSGTMERLVLIGATAGLDTDAERDERRASDERLARRIEHDGVPAFLDDWLALPLFAGLPADPIDRAHRESNNAAGLAHSLRTFGTGAMSPLWGRLDTIEIPVLVIAGERDAKFTALGRRLVDGLPDAELRVIDGAGHAAHIEAPNDVSAMIADWLG